MFKPKLLTTMKTYDFSQFVGDLSAGVIVGIVAIPLAIAFAIASGVSPEKGLFTAIVAGFLISALGGSRVQIGGPTGAFVVIVYGIVQKYGLDGLTIATIMAGIILIIMGFAGFGSMIKYIPYPVIAGFTSGIAVIIFSSQISDLLGLAMKEIPSEFIEKWAAYFSHLDSVNYYAVGISLVSLLIILFWQRISKKVPGSLVALIVATVAAAAFDLPVETIGSRFGQIPSTLPMPHIPRVDFQTFRAMIQPAFTIALLAGIEALLSAVVADGMIGDKHRSNTELIANGVANLVAPLFGGIPATGAIARTATNIKNGGKTPVAGIVHALTLLFIMLFFGKWASYIPLASLAAVLVVVAYNMSEWRSFVALLRSPRSDVIVLLLTFSLTVLLDLTVAIEIGMVMAAFLFMRRMAHVTQVNVITSGIEDAMEEESENVGIKMNVPKGVEVYEINGPLFFGAAHKFEEALSQVDKRPRLMIIRMRYVPAIDSTGLRMLDQIVRKSQKQKIGVILSGVQEQPMHAMEQAGLLDLIGRENVCTHFEAALRQAEKLLQLMENSRQVDEKAG